MVLLQDIVQILNPSIVAAAAQSSFLFHSCKRRELEVALIGVDDAGLRMRWIAERLTEQALGHCGIAHRREQEGDSGTGGIDGSIKVTPTALDPNIRFTDPPGFVGRPELPTPPLFQPGTVRLHPPPDLCVIGLQAAFGEQLFNIAERQRITQIPAHHRLPPLEDYRSGCLLHGFFRLPATAAKSCNPSNSTIHFVGMVPDHVPQWPKPDMVVLLSRLGALVQINAFETNPHFMGTLKTRLRATKKGDHSTQVSSRLKTRRVLLELAVLLLGGMLSAAALAQVTIQPGTSAAQPGTSATPPGTSATPQDLAKSVHNPFADFVKIPLQSTTGFSVGPHHNGGESLNIQPVIPFSLNARWDLIVRPSQSATYQPSPHEQFGLNDLQISFFVTPDNASEWIWGAGPIFQFPTATSDALGTGRWSAGPTAALIYSKGPWFNGVLAYQLMSIAGDRARGSVNQTYVEPELSYNFESGWYVDCDPQMTFDWTTDTANGWTIPIGADVGNAFNIESHAMSFQVGAYDLAKRPDGAPQWIVRVQVTALFPTGK